MEVIKSVSQRIREMEEEIPQLRYTKQYILNKYGAKCYADLPDKQRGVYKAQNKRRKQIQDILDRVKQILVENNGTFGH